ncbi:MAG: hypothetical protein CVU44_12880 [Chloroflexi bacterium HGW-Chloroflexi-6]|nr:MAG: hypothetical protein CVU44_12880 [Chloroflexi bacterium HGW-Chloroflexi-6]
MGFEKPITIQKAISEIQSNKYVLPAIQREFVWKAEQIEKLFDSLLRGYPIGSFLFWKVTPERIGDFQFYHFMDHYHERDFRHNEPYNPPAHQDVTAILDGQQRLTALNIGINGWYAYKLPRYWWNNDEGFPKQELYINLNRPQPQETETATNGFEVRFLRKVDLKKPEEKKYWFKVGDVMQFANMQSVFNFCVKSGLINDRDTYSSDTLVGLWNVLTQQPLVNYFLEEEQNLDKVLNIFIRVNSGGTPLSYSDMLLSIATAAWKELDARQEIYDLVEQLNQVGDGFNFDKDFVLKAGLVLSDIQSIEFRVTSFNRQNMLTIEENWEGIVGALKGAAYLLASWGYNWQTLVSSFAVIPLAYHLYKLNSPKNFVTASQYAFSREKMLHWLRVAILKRTFSGPTDNTLRAIRRAMQTEGNEIFPQNLIFDELKTTPKSMSFDEAELDGLLSYRYGQNYVFSVLAMLYPWLKYDQQFHVDHIFPRSRFNSKELISHGISEDKWHLWLDHANDIGNLQLLQGPVNQSKSDQAFESWLMGECPTPNDLSSYKSLHLIPDGELTFEKFPEFLEARTNIMRDKLALLLGVKLVDGKPSQK